MTEKLRFILHALVLIALCVSGAVAQETPAQQQQGQAELQRQSDAQAQPAEATATPQQPDPNETLTPSPLANQTVDGDFVFTSPGQFTYPRDIRLSDNFGGLRFYGTNSLTTTPSGAAIQFFGNNATPFNGQLFLDSGALNSAALIFRTAPTGGTITERMRVTSSGQVGIGTTNPAFATLRVANNGTADAVRAESSSNNGNGVLGTATGPNGVGVNGFANGSFGVAVRGSVSGGATLAGLFFGDVSVNGRLTKSSGSFKIDHPLDPENKYLSHSFVESPDMKNIYDGTVTLDRLGRATVTLPDYFEALNTEFRYQLTALGLPGPNLYVAAEIKGNTFKVAGGKPGMKVSWMVTGIRRDAYAEKHRIKVEEEKPSQERGTYLHPEAFGQPQEKSVGRAHHSELNRQNTEASAQPKEK